MPRIIKGLCREMAEAYHVSIFKIKFIETYNLHLHQLKPYTISGQEISCILFLWKMKLSQGKN